MYRASSLSGSGSERECRITSINGSGDAAEASTMVKNSKIRRCAGEKRKKERYESDGEMGVLWTGKEQRVLSLAALAKTAFSNSIVPHPGLSGSSTQASSLIYVCLGYNPYLCHTQLHPSILNPCSRVVLATRESKTFDAFLRGNHVSLAIAKYHTPRAVRPDGYTSHRTFYRLDTES